MKLEKFNLGEKLLKREELMSIKGGNTRSNGQVTRSAGPDSDTATSDQDQPSKPEQFV